MREIRLSKHFRIQPYRTIKMAGVRRWFGVEWEPDMLGGVMVASITLFGISFVYLGTAA